MDEARFVLYRRNSGGIHEPVGRFESAELARDHANQDAIMRGLINDPYQWGASYDGAWYCVHPSEPPLATSIDHYGEYVVIDSGWRPVESITIVQLPTLDLDHEQGG